MALYLYDAHARDCVGYPATTAGFNKAVDDMRRTGGFLRDTAYDIVSASSACQFIADIAGAAGNITPTTDEHATIFTFLGTAQDAVTREDWPVANVSILAALHALNRLYAITDVETE